jgi:DNA-binding NarL/FixJ family response regulator
VGFPEQIRPPRQPAPPRAVTLLRSDGSGAAGAAGTPRTGGAGGAVCPVAAPVTVAVLASDPITAEGTVAYLRARPGVTPLGADGAGQADVVLILASWVTEETLAWMQAAAEKAAERAAGEVRFVLVGDGVREPELLRAVSFGLVSVLPRQGTDHERIVRAILAVRDGRVEMPEVALGWLVGQIRAIHRDVLTPHGLTATGLESREVDVLRLLADGLDTIEIAGRLSYSERTVKNIIHGVLTRLNLRNRPHAVAFALRNGLL